MKPPVVAHKALVHPAWVLSLVVLLVNDHALKGSVLAPGWLTGKLSDVTGYFIFPMLLAALLGVRTRRAALACHAAAAALLLVLELSPGACLLVERAVGVRMWADPTDLIALASIALSWVVLVPAAEGHEPVRRLLARSLAVVGAVASMATSQPPPTTTNVPQNAEGFLWNRAGQDVQVRISAPRPDVDFKCEDLDTFTPDQLFRPNYFRVVRDVVVVTNGRISLDGFEHKGGCNVLLIAVEGSIQDVIVTWRTGSLGQVDIANLNAASTPATAITIESGINGAAVSAPQRIKSAPIVVTPAATVVGCGPPAPLADTAWSEPLPAGGTLHLTAVSRGPDGCDQLTLVPSGGGAALRYFVCIDPLPMPLAVGDDVTFRRPQGASGTGVVITGPTAMVAAVAGAADVALQASCDPVAHGCVVGRQRAVQVATPEGSLTLVAGQTKMIQGKTWAVMALATRAEDVLVADHGCGVAPAPGFTANYAWVAKMGSF